MFKQLIIDYFQWNPELYLPQRQLKIGRPFSAQRCDWARTHQCLVGSTCRIPRAQRRCSRFLFNDALSPTPLRRQRGFGRDLYSPTRSVFCDDAITILMDASLLPRHNRVSESGWWNLIQDILGDFNQSNSGLFCDVGSESSFSAIVRVLIWQMHNCGETLR